MKRKEIHKVLSTKDLSIGYESKKGHQEIAKNVNIELQKG